MARPLSCLRRRRADSRAHRPPPGRPSVVDWPPSAEAAACPAASGRLGLFALAGAWSPAHTDLSLGDDQEPVELRAVLSEDGGEPVELSLRALGAQAEEEHPRLGEAAADNQLAEVAVVGDEDAPLTPGNRQHLLVAQARGIVVGDAGDVVPARFEESRDAKLGVLIQ